MRSCNNIILAKAKFDFLSQYNNKKSLNYRRNRPASFGECFLKLEHICHETEIFKQMHNLRNLAACVKKQANVSTNEITTLTQKPITFLFHKIIDKLPRDLNVR